MPIKPPSSPGILLLVPWAGLLLLLLPLQLAAQLGGTGLEGKPVRKIELLGLKKMEPAAVKAMMVTKEGRPFRAAELDRDLKTLIQKDVFVFIPWVEAIPSKDGQGVIVRLEASDVSTRVLRIVFLGAVNFDRGDLVPVIRTKAGSPASDFTLQLDRQALVAFYKKKGYHFVDVDFIKRREPSGDLIVFKITEGPEVKIKRVRFKGNKSFQKDDLLKVMPFTEEPGLLNSKEFVLDQVRRDVIQLNRFYVDHGFLDARCYLADWIPSADHEKVKLFITIDEGQPYKVRSIRIEGMTLFRQPEIKKLLRTKVGQRYEPGGKLFKDRRDVREAYEERGYTRARVRDLSVIDEKQPEVDVILRIIEGNLVRVGQIIVRGNRETQDRILRRELDLYTGQPLNLKKLKRVERRIRALNYWEAQGGVNVARPTMPFQSYQIFKDSYISLADTERSDIKDVVITVKEKDTGSLRFAAGVGSSAGFIGDITYRKDNFDPLDLPEGFGDILDAFTGGGEFLTLSFQPGTVVSRYRVAWGDPRLFDSPYGVVQELFKTTFFREDWDEERTGASIRVTRQFGDELSVGLSLKDQQVDVTNINRRSPQIVFDFEGTNRVTTLTLDVRMTRLDNFLDPTRGWSANLLLEHGGLWGDIDFNKAQISGQWYTPLGVDSMDRVSVLQLQGSIGWANESGSTPDIPIFERFFLGGSHSLRGFRFRGVGPHDNGDPVGGKAIWTAGAQYAFPLLGQQLRGVAFLDTGALAEDFSSSEITQVRAAVGFGVRLVVPFLGPRPIAIDFGIPILREDQDKTTIISFSFGSNF